MLQIHDIKPIVEIPSYSFYIYLFLIVVSILVLVLVSYFIYNHFKNKKSNLDKEYYKLLKNLDLSEPKSAAYTISKYGRLLAKSERQMRLINELHQNLEEFKYKKSIDKTISKDIQEQFKRFMESLDVK